MKKYLVIEPLFITTVYSINGKRENLFFETFFLNSVRKIKIVAHLAL